MKLGKYLERVREKKPLIHNITNYVTVNDVANILLASGASPIMADEPEEMEEITSICDGLYINIGTLNKGKIEAMMRASKQARSLNHPITLDPVGVGTSALRSNIAEKLIKTAGLDVIRGNISEIKALAGVSANTRGVDAAEEDSISQDSLDQTVSLLKSLSKETGAVLVVSGPVDLICDKDTCLAISNGCPEMSQITGSGCMLSGLVSAFIAASPEQPLEASAAAVALMGLAGETAKARLKDEEGNATFRNAIIDAVYRMEPDKLDKGAKIEELK